MRTFKKMLGVALLLAPVMPSFAALSADEVKQLGDKLTPWGAEKTGNAAGTIPAWSGMPKAPANFVPGSGVYPDPFVADKPLHTITAANMQQYADKLSEGTKALLKKYPTFHLNVYPTRRTYDQPQEVSEACLKNTSTAKTTDNGVALEGAFNCIPFPIPKTGNEVMWNHLLGWQGFGMSALWDGWYMDAAGRRILGARSDYTVMVPYYSKGKTAEWLKTEHDNNYQTVMQMFKAPAAMVGSGLMSRTNLNPVAISDKMYQYQVGQRRVRLMPDMSYDFPALAFGGVYVVDEIQMFYGAQDRFDFKLVGKKEMYIMDNSYKLLFSPAEQVITKDHMNSDALRWELRRVWVVEATLKPDFRHVYQKRTFYFDEDNAVIGLSDQYDKTGDLVHSTWATSIGLYDSPDKANYSTGFGAYDFKANNYVVVGIPFATGYLKSLTNPDPKKLTPEYMATQLQR